MNTNKLSTVFTWFAVYVFYFSLGFFADFISTDLEVYKFGKYAKWYSSISIGLIALYGLVASFIDFKSKGTRLIHFLTSIEVHVGILTVFLAFFLHFKALDMNSKMYSIDRDAMRDAMIERVEAVGNSTKDEVHDVGYRNDKNTYLVAEYIDGLADSAKKRDEQFSQKVTAYIDGMQDSARERDKKFSEMLQKGQKESLDSLKRFSQAHQKNIENTDKALSELKKSIDSTNVTTAETHRQLQENAEKTTKVLSGITMTLNTLQNRDQELIGALQGINQVLKDLLQTMKDSLDSNGTKSESKNGSTDENKTNGDG